MDSLRNILVGLDLDYGTEEWTEGSRAAVGQALWLAKRTGARVEFMHSTFNDPEDGQPLTEESLATARKALDALVHELGAGSIATELTFTDERPWVALTRKAMAGETDLVVVAKRNSSRGDDRRLGSVSMKLVRKCPGPVWVVKPGHDSTHRCVVSATDLSAVGDLAVRYGAFVAEIDDCELCIVHAWQVPMELQLSAARIGDEATAERKHEIEEKARAHIRAVPGIESMGERAGIFLACASPSRAILELSSQKDPDLVVMGTISRGGVAGMLVGNTAEKLLNRIECSILTVKPDDFVCPLEA